MRVIYTPEKRYLEQLEHWLLEEKNNNLSNFYQNFINEEYTDDNFVCLVNDNDEAIGYMDYTFCNEYSSLNIAIIKNEYNGKGYCKLLFESLSEHLANKGTMALKLFCEPLSTKMVWMKLGFEEFKEKENHQFLNSKNFKLHWLFKTIKPSLKPTIEQNIENKIELWTNDEYKINDFDKPTYTWDITSLHAPIIYPVDRNWKIRLTQNNQVTYDGKIKRFGAGSFDIGDFLIINTLE